MRIGVALATMLASTGAIAGQDLVSFTVEGDAHITLRVVQVATGKTLLCGQDHRRTTGACPLPESLLTPGDYAVVVDNAPSSPGPRWLARYSLPEHVISVRLRAHVVLAGPRAGLTLSPDIQVAAGDAALEVAPVKAGEYPDSR